MHYSIIEDGGFAGFGQGVEWCVTGLDRNWAYNPAAGPPAPDLRTSVPDRSGRFVPSLVCLDFVLEMF